MQIFLDSAHIEDIHAAKALGFLDGVTTNPSLLAKAGRPMLTVLREICEAVDGPVSAEVLSIDEASMLREAQDLVKIAPNIVVKIPLTEAGLRVVHTLTQAGISTNVTLCFSAVQAVLAAKAGATYISPFVGRLDDVGHDGMALIAEILTAYRHYGYTTKVLVASVRHVGHIRETIRLGAHVATVPLAVIKQMLSHPLTDRGLSQFVSDAAKIPK